jgi:hypothetical protein
MVRMERVTLVVYLGGVSTARAGPWALMVGISAFTCLSLHYSVEQ